MIKEMMHVLLTRRDVEVSHYHDLLSRVAVGGLSGAKGAAVACGQKT